MHRVHLASTIGALALALLVLGAPPVQGQEQHEPMEIVIGSKYGQTPAEEASAAAELSGGLLKFIVEDQVCATVRLEPADAPQSVRIGTAQQPQICSEPGAVLRLVRADGEHLALALDLVPGASYHLYDWQLWLGEPRGAAAVDFEEVPQGPILMTADGERCRIARISTRTLFFGVGAPGYDFNAPLACKQAGSELSFYDADGRVFASALLDTRAPFFARSVRSEAAVDPEVASLFGELAPCLDERIRRDTGRRGAFFSASVLFDRASQPIGCAPREIYELLGDHRVLGGVIRSAEDGAEWAAGRQIPEELTPEDLHRFFPNLRAEQMAQASASDKGATHTALDSKAPTLAVQPSEAHPTDVAAATRNVAASVVASVALALGVVAAAQLAARRRRRVH